MSVTFGFNVIIGVISGVLTALVIWVCVLVFNHLFLPWYRRWVYTGLDISGEWWLYIFEGTQDAKLNLRQHGERLTGECVFIAKEGTSYFERTRSFVVSGIIVNQFVQLTYRYADRTRLGLGTLLMRITRDGQYISGHVSMYDVMTSNIEAAACWATRPGYTGFLEPMSTDTRNAVEHFGLELEDDPLDVKPPPRGEVKPVRPSTPTQPNATDVVVSADVE